MPASKQKAANTTAAAAAGGASASSRGRRSTRTTSTSKAAAAQRRASTGIPSGLAVITESDASDNEPLMAKRRASAAGAPLPQIIVPEGSADTPRWAPVIVTMLANGQRMIRFEAEDELVPASIVEDTPAQLSACDAVEIYSRICRHLDPHYWQSVLTHIADLQDRSRAGMEALSRFAEVAYIRVHGLYLFLCSRYNQELRDWANRNSADELSRQDLELSRAQLRPQSMPVQSPEKRHPPTLRVTPATPITHVPQPPASPEAVVTDSRFTARVGTPSAASESLSRQLQLRASEQIASGSHVEPYQPQGPGKSTSSSRRRALPIEYTMVNQALNHADATRELSYEHDWRPAAPAQAPPHPMHPQWPTAAPVSALSMMQHQQRVVSAPESSQRFNDFGTTSLPTATSAPQLALIPSQASTPAQGYITNDSGVMAQRMRTDLDGNASNMQHWSSLDTGPGQAPIPASGTHFNPSNAASFRVNNGNGIRPGSLPTTSTTMSFEDMSQPSWSWREWFQRQGALQGGARHSAHPADTQSAPFVSNFNQQHANPYPSVAGLAYPWPKGGDTAFASSHPSTMSTQQAPHLPPLAYTSAHQQDAQPEARKHAYESAQTDASGHQVPTGITLTRMAVIYGLPFQLVASDPFRVYILILQLLRQLELSHLSHTVRLISTLSGLPSSDGTIKTPSTLNHRTLTGQEQQSSSAGWAWIIFNTPEQRNDFIKAYGNKVQLGWTPPSIESSPTKKKKTTAAKKSGDGRDEWPYFIHTAEDFLAMNHETQRGTTHTAPTTRPQRGLMLPPPVPQQPGARKQQVHQGIPAQALSWRNGRATSAQPGPHAGFPRQASTTTTDPRDTHQLFAPGHIPPAGPNVPAYSTMPPTNHRALKTSPSLSGLKRKRQDSSGRDKPAPDLWHDVAATAMRDLLAVRPRTVSNGSVAVPALAGSSRPLRTPSASILLQPVNSSTYANAPLSASFAHQAGPLSQGVGPLSGYTLGGSGQMSHALTPTSHIRATSTGSFPTGPLASGLVASADYYDTSSSNGPWTNTAVEATPYVTLPTMATPIEPTFTHQGFSGTQGAQSSVMDSSMSLLRARSASGSMMPAYMSMPETAASSLVQLNPIIDAPATSSALSTTDALRPPVPGPVFQQNPANNNEVAPVSEPAPESTEVGLLSQPSGQATSEQIKHFESVEAAARAAADAALKFAAEMPEMDSPGAMAVNRPPSSARTTQPISRTPTPTAFGGGGSSVGPAMTLSTLLMPVESRVPDSYMRSSAFLSETGNTGDDAGKVTSTPTAALQGDGEGGNDASAPPAPPLAEGSADGPLQEGIGVDKLGVSPSALGPLPSDAVEPRSIFAEETETGSLS